MRPLVSAALSLAACLVMPALPASAAIDGAAKASAYVEELGNQAIAAITDKKLNKEQKQARLDKIFADNVDIAWVGRFVMGRYWREATDTQKAQYLKEYETFLIKHYTSRFAEYTSGTFKITGTKDDGDDEYTVSMHLMGDDKGSEPVLVDYRLRKEERGFKVFDVIVEGVSLITTQRSEFSSVIARHDIDFLIAQLRNKSIPVTVAK